MKYLSGFVLEILLFPFQSLHEYTCINVFTSHVYMYMCIYINMPKYFRTYTYMYS